jgi:hypothetical protein
VINTARILHLANGNIVLQRLREAGIEGTVVAWNDLLHEGPVPEGLGVAALREVRAGFLAGCGWGSYRNILRELEHRDHTVESAVSGMGTGASHRVDEIVLWFEHDLYDQLQLIQVLERLPIDGAVRITQVVPATYLGHIPAGDYPNLLAERRVVSSAELLAARDAWQAFRSADPRGILGALPRLTVLPHLSPALRRHAEQFPSLENGLSRTEQQTLEAVAAGTSRLRDVYSVVNHEREEATFMGDAGFLFHISSLVRSHRPLLAVKGGGDFDPVGKGTLDLELSLTGDGARVLEGGLDRVACCGIDRWLGGVRLEGNGPVWRWDRARETVRLA